MGSRGCRCRTNPLLIPSHPFISSFVVDPTSGEPPFLYSIAFRFKEQIDNVAYKFEVWCTTSALVCPPLDSDFAFNKPITDGLFSTGQRATYTSVAAGRCRVCEARIIDLSTNEIIQRVSATIQN